MSYERPQSAQVHCSFLAFIMPQAKSKRLPACNTQSSVMTSVSVNT